MCTYAEFEIGLEKPVNDDTKQTKRQAYNLLLKQGFTVDEYINRPELPARVAYIWKWYAEMASICRELTFAEIKAWQDLNSFKLLEHELSAIIKLEKIRRRT